MINLRGFTNFIAKKTTIVFILCIFASFSAFSNLPHFPCVTRTFKHQKEGVSYNIFLFSEKMLAFC